ncbi:MAG: gliding motility-associated C-terminal domain-containing protein [Taibaiella sp.]|nr:gliding motility-associated C-terminal domain-containing protein [Taibaiella sp.]
MKKNFLVLLLVFISLGFFKPVSAQLIGINCFLQGQWLEVGVNQMGGFGTCGSPLTYHTHGGFGLLPPITPGANMDASYDWGRDGWTVGSPACAGPYTQPGYPQEGWSIEVAGTEYRNGGWGGACGPAFAVPGGHTGYTNVGGRMTEYWNGNIAGLNIRAETRVDTYASWAVITAVIRNTTAAPIPNVFYQRTNDPDNASLWGGGSSTRNRIVHQNEDARHRVLATSHGESGIFNATNSFMALGTKDCRARCSFISGLAPSSRPSLMWNGIVSGAGGAGLSTTTMNMWVLGATNYTDQGMTLIYNLGTIAAGDSAIISYAYIYNGASSIDSAFPDPRIVVGGIAYPVVPPPHPNNDTFDVCAYPGMTTLPVDILNAEDKCWSWSKWTWSPSLGLAATTGAHNIINTTVLPPVITYTITGTDSAFGMYSCNMKTFYLTIHTCNGAEANSPCVGDTLWLNAPGDSTAATYQWYGPAPSTAVFATTQKTFLFPATAAMSGTYSVIKTVGGMPDTSITIVTIRHKPTVWASSNSPLCIGGATPLLLTSVSDSPSVTYSWTATPPPFVSSLQNPTISGFSASDTGWYQVVVTSVFGCKDTARVRVSLAEVPPPPTVTAVTPYCQNDPFVPFVITGVVPGGVVLWYGSPTGGVGTSTVPVINTSIVGLTTLYFSQKIGSCEGPRDSIKVRVNPIPAPIIGPSGVCQYFTITLTNPTPGGVWSSSNPAVATIDPGTGLLSGLTGGTVTISYTLPTTCRRTTVVTVHAKPAPPTFGPHRECQYVPGRSATATGTNLTWYGLGVTPGTLIPPTPNTDTLPGVYNYYVTQTSSFGCVSDSATYPVRIYPEPAAPIVSDTVYCQGVQAPPLTAVGTGLLWYVSATSTPGSATAPTPSTLSPGMKTFYVTQTIDLCESPRAGLNVTILDTPDFKITPEKPWVCQFDSISLNYTGGVPAPPATYFWQLPTGGSFVNGTMSDQKDVVVKFDSARGQHWVYLTVSNYGGKCAATNRVNIKVVPSPSAHMYVKPDICLGDTITLALTDRSANAYKYTWLIDGLPMLGSPVVNIVSANSNTGGPFVISWHEKGRHILNVQGFTTEGCKSLITADTINVHELPDASFDFITNTKKLCIEDSVLFKAVKQDYSCTYKWEPEHFFTNDNRPEIWGRVEQARSMVMLTVTDPFGCTSRFSKQINPDQCCTVSFPNAFSPNDDGKNDRFRPIFAGYRRFHIFRVSNRWGQTVFESANTNPSWDGKYNGVPQDMGVYFYYLKYDCGGKTLEAKGDVTIIR